MIDHQLIQLAMRSRLLTLNVCTAGVTAPIVHWVTVADGSWTLIGTPTRVPAAVVVGGIPLDLVGDDDGALIEYAWRDIAFTTNGDKLLSLLVKKSSAYAAHEFDMYDATAGVFRCTCKIDFTAAVPVLTVGAGATLVSSVAVDTGYRITLLASGLVAANLNRFIFWPAAGAVADLATLYIGDIQGWDTGIALSATATGYARTVGSFLTDGFAPGMQILAAGFATAANNGLSVIASVTATAVTVTKTPATVAEAAGAGRTLTCALPATRAWENIGLQPTVGTPYIAEQYLPGGAPVLETCGPLGRIEAFPMYVINVYLPTTAGGQPTGIGASSAYAKAITNHFPPKWAVTLSNGDVVRVRGDLAPYRGQLLQDSAGWAIVTVTIPLRVETTNSI